MYAQRNKYIHIVTLYLQLHIINRISANAWALPETELPLEQMVNFHEFSIIKFIEKIKTYKDNLHHQHEHERCSK